MKTLKQNKVLALMLALITVFCTLIGVTLSNTANVAFADSSRQITVETFPETSTWEEKATTEIKPGTIYRFRCSEEVGLAFQITRKGIAEGEDIFIALFRGGGTILSLGEYDVDNLTLEELRSKNVAFRFSEEGKFVDFIFYGELESVEFVELEGEPITVDAYETKMVVELVEPDDSCEAPCDKDTGINDFVNNNFRLVPILGSLVLVVVSCCLYKLLKKKRK